MCSGKGPFLLDNRVPLSDPEFWNVEFRNPSSPSGCSGSRMDHFRCAVLDSCYAKLRWSEGPWWMFLVKVGARTAPVSCIPEQRLVRPETLEPYLNPELFPEQVSSSLPRSWAYSKFGIGTTSSLEHVIDFFLI